MGDLSKALPAIKATEDESAPVQPTAVNPRADSLSTAESLTPTPPAGPPPAITARVPLPSA